MEAAAAREWLGAYRDAWEAADATPLQELFAGDASYRSHILHPPHLGIEAIQAYWRRVTATQEDVSVRMGEPLVDGDWVAAEWWTTMRDRDEGAHVTLPGVLLLYFADGRCTQLWEYWGLAEGAREPFGEWGRVDDGPTSRTRDHAVRWADGWMDGWRRGDPETIARLYSPAASFRSEPFREPHVGRAGTLGYARQAFREEDDVSVRFGAPLAWGSSAAVEYWATMREAGEDVTLAGCSMLILDDDGLVTWQHDYWHMEPGTQGPPEGWGERES